MLCGLRRSEQVSVLYIQMLLSSVSERVGVRLCEREVLVKARSELALVEQIEIAAGDENSGETGERVERPDRRFCSGRFYAA